ncbi:hypothetical protein NEOLEDRAFT_178227 [Neolentinus lepideus HHB14362 ss-1]|uniref:Protein-S-isoprenylcysteine O-methyltransferase n=1 Tax=Neolentinus lepideus HHB14362 ss-1 TaxID=1314782 RepID=A0A165TMI0_9AGAM|nr:hypothetical protein NEOLEDRAFT_178227 [Neolentinus lepideus HHB14362 ss-1]
MSLLRIPVVLAAAFGLHTTMTNPNPPVSAEETKKYSAPRPSQFVLWWPTMFKTAVWLGTVCEGAIIVSSQFQEQKLSQDILSALVVGPRQCVDNIRLTPTVIAGSLLSVLGGYVRYRCYKALGALFTYQLSIKHSHRLVTTGPYSVVRHPSYTSGEMSLLGSFICFFGPGSWLRECGVLETFVGKTLVGAAVSSWVALVVFSVYRTGLEDRTLREEFQESWDEWARRVPYKLIPFVF